MGMGQNFDLETWRKGTYLIASYSHFHNSYSKMQCQKHSRILSRSFGDPKLVLEEVVDVQEPGGEVEMNGLV
jgi:hypothetical protein